MSKKKVGEIILNLLFIFIAFMFIIISSKYSSYTSTRLGAKTFPTIISVLMIIFAISNMVKAILNKSEHVAAVSAATEENDKHLDETVLEAFIYRHRIIIAILLSFVYYYLLYLVGFIIGSIIFIPVMLLILECRKFLTIVLVTLGFIAFTVISFQVLLRVPLPAGVIFR